MTAPAEWNGIREHLGELAQKAQRATEDQPRPTPPDALAALKQWESDTGSEASPTEGNAFIDGFHAGRSQLDLQGNYFKLVSAGEAQGEAPQHGKDCPKVPHIGGGYLHAEEDDSPYDVDGVKYCGRCHRFLDRAHPSQDAPLSQEELEKSVDDRYRQFVQRHPQYHVSKAQRGDFWRQIAIGYARQLQSIHEREMADSRARSTPSLPAQDAPLQTVLGAIEGLVGDDFCEDLEMRRYGDHDPTDELSGTEKTAQDKFSRIYRLAHAFNKSHSCYRVHDDWRKELERYGQTGGSTPSPDLKDSVK